MIRSWRIPEGLRVLPDGSWRVGDHPVAHEASLVHLKKHLVFEDGGAFVVDGPQRMPVTLEGPAFLVTRLVLDPDRAEASAVLDDGSSELLRDDVLGMNVETGRFECLVRGGRARALLSRAAHERLLEKVEEEAGRFFLEVGPRRLRIRA